MPAKYHCSASIRTNIFPFLMCSFMKESGVDYNLRENAMKICCAKQHYCPCTKQSENTSECQKCFDYHVSLQKQKGE